jgi:uncharacterized membrane protein
MSQVHLHLLITHLPVFGAILGALVLAYGILAKSSQTKIAAYCLFIIAAIGSGIAYLTGEGAEEAIEKIQGVSEHTIKLHENSAMYALISLIVLGLVSVFALVEVRYKTSLLRFTAAFTLILSLISFGLIARTGYLGGQIRHTEISTGALQNSGGGQTEKDDD